MTDATNHQPVLTHAGLPVSKKPGIVLSQKALHERNGWATSSDTQMIRFNDLPPEMWTPCLDAITQQLQRRVAQATIERSPVDGSDVADWQIRMTSRGFSLIVEAVARRQVDNVMLEVHRFVQRPLRRWYVMCLIGFLIAFLSVAVGVTAILARFDGWRDVWPPALGFGVAVGFVCIFLNDPAAGAAMLNGRSGPPRPDDYGYKRVSPGIESESRALLEAVKASALAVERDRLGA